jgi:rSAM/selenodomain-associated transferase 1
MTQPVRQLTVMAKYWQPGRVKTRLAADLGEQVAASLYREFLRTTLFRFERSAERCVLSYSPPEQGEAMQQLAGIAWSLEVQCEGDLGQRMRNAMQQAFSAGAETVVVLGADSPTLPLEHVRRAYESLRISPVVLGPTPDSGYYLVGARAAVPPIFEQIDWSTPAVWSQTIQRLSDARIAFEQLPTWYDVDNLDDLTRLHRELADAHSDDDVLARLADAIRHALPI